MRTISWGIMGCGTIAHTFATSLQAVSNAQLLGCASRSVDRATLYAKQYRVSSVYTSYLDLVKNKQIDVVYIATTHNAHFELIKMCLEHNKHVLCEKPITVNSTQSEQLFALAKKHNKLLIEAVWTRFLPAIQALQQQLTEQVIGNVLSVHAHFSISGNFGPSHRLKNPDTAGGSLLDLGIYPITMAHIVFPSIPERIVSSAVLGETGVDDRAFYLFEYSEGRRASLSSSFSSCGPTEAIIEGTHGYIRIPHFLGAQGFVVTKEGKENRYDYPFASEHNFVYEIEHMHECIMEGRSESNILPHQSSQETMRIMDTLRAQWQLRYPFE